MRLALVLVCVVSCVPAPNSRVKRWPTHRQDRDARIEKLEKQQVILIEHIARLEKQMLALRAGSGPSVPPGESPVTAPTSATAPTSTSGTP